MLVSHLKNRPASSIINFDELFDELFAHRPMVTNKNFMPAVNISESDTSFHIEMAIPGFNKEEVSIKVEKNLMTISGEKKESSTDDSKKIKRKEFHYKSFSRSFTLSDNIQSDKVEAKYENGVLNLTIPKKEIEKEKTAVEIKIA
ncbi:MAG: Hsp20/alpha crystallin family protein [Bacteroidota bacterium]